MASELDRSLPFAPEVVTPEFVDPTPVSVPRSGPFKQWLKHYGDKALIPVVIAAGIALWAGLVAWQEYPVFILPGPEVVWRKLKVNR